MAILTQKDENEHLLSKSFKSFFTTYRISDILKKSNIKKEKGISVNTIFFILLKTVFLGKSLSRLIRRDEIKIQKDAFYRFINSVHANWDRFISLLSSRVIEKIVPLTSEKRVNTLILDDTVFKRARSKAVELLTRVQDHTDMKFYRGFRCQTLGWSDGNSFVPIGYILLSSAKEKTRINGMNEAIDKRTNGYKRRMRAITNSYDTAFEMLGNARKTKVPATHVLFDSWFSEMKMFRKLRELKFHGIGMLKARKGRQFWWKGRYYNLENLYAIKKNWIPSQDCMTSIIVNMNVPPKGTNSIARKSSQKLRIVFVRNMDRKRDWIAIATTDLSLSDKEVVALYARRWDIEVFFKTVKEHLGFATDFSGRSFDMMCAEIAIVFTRYIMLTITVRNETDLRTGGDLYFYVYDELRDFTFAEALLVIFELIDATLKKFVPMSRVKEAKAYFMSHLPSHFKEIMLLASCES